MTVLYQGNEESTAHTCKKHFPLILSASAKRFFYLIKFTTIKKENLGKDKRYIIDSKKVYLKINFREFFLQIAWATLNV